MRLRARGGAIGRARTALLLAAACVLVFDGAGLVINRMLLDEAARVAAVRAAEAVRAAPRAQWRVLPQLAEQEARDSLADQGGVELLDVRVDEDRATLTVRRRAHVLLAGKVSALAGQVEPRVHASAPLDPLPARSP